MKLSDEANRLITEAIGYAAREIEEKLPGINGVSIQVSSVYLTAMGMGGIQIAVSTLGKPESKEPSAEAVKETERMLNELKKEDK